MPQTRGVRSVGRTNPPDGLAVNSASALQLSTANITLVSNERLAAELESLPSWGRVEITLQSGPGRPQREGRFHRQ